MWENRKLASWVVSFFCLLCTLPHMRKQFYGKCDFCHRQTRCSERGDDEKNGNLYTSQNCLQPAKTDYRQRHINRKSHTRCFSLNMRMKFLGQPCWISTRREELQRNRCLQHSAWARAVVQQTYTLFAFVSSTSLLFLHFQHPADRASQEADTAF